MVIGSLSTADLVPVLRRLEQRFDREINATRYSDKEFEQKIRKKDHFLLSVLSQNAVMIKGTQHELAAATRRTQNTASSVLNRVSSGKRELRKLTAPGERRGFPK